MAAIDANTAAWLNAIERANYGAARQHLRGDQDVNVRGVGGQTALHVAAKAGHLGKVQKLIKDRADTNATDDQGNTPLMVAEFNERPRVVSFLIEIMELVRALATHLGHKPTPNQIHSAMVQKRWRAFRDRVRQRLEDNTAKLLQAARKGDLAAVRRLVEGDQVYVNAVDPSTNETVFSVALAGGWHFVCDYLLSNGAHAYGPCVVDGQVQSALMTAVVQGNVSLVRRILSHRVHLWSPRSDATKCVLTQVVQNGSSEMVDVLLEAGAQFQRRGDLPKPVYHAMLAP